MFTKIMMAVIGCFGRIKDRLLLRYKQFLLVSRYGKKDFTSVTLDDVQRVSEKGIRYYDPAQKPFSVYGVLPPDEQEQTYRRMPAAVAESVSEAVQDLSKNTSGGRIRFCTDSEKLHLKAFYPRIVSMVHFAQSGVSGFGVYVRKDGAETFCALLCPNSFNCAEQTEFDGSVELPFFGMKEITICMPLYNDVEKVFVGLDTSAQVLPDPGYAYEKPVVFYGSSITQGGCASRPGAEYAAILSRRLHFDYINLGFSGSAKGERAMAEYIKTLPMQAFVMDYDHNAPTPDELERTHEPFFRIIRDACPDLPVLFLSRPDPDRNEDNRRRFAVIQKTYDNAVQSGDRNVYLLDGAGFFDDAMCMNDPTVDRVHPTDLGFFLMARAIEPCLKAILQKTEKE